MFETAGFTMYDLGRDVPIEAFVDKAQEVNARLICLSTLMTTTMIGMQRVVELLKERGLYGKIKVMIGGGPVSKNFCDKIGADAYTGNAISWGCTRPGLGGRYGFCGTASPGCRCGFQGHG